MCCVQDAVGSMEKEERIFETSRWRPSSKLDSLLPFVLLRGAPLVAGTGLIWSRMIVDPLESVPNLCRIFLSKPKSLGTE